jgi:hypothetical protein
MRDGGSTGGLQLSRRGGTLREKVAQAELAAHLYGQNLRQIGEELKE